MNLKDRHVLVTGASRGVGRSIAEALAQRGARLTLVARNAQALQLVADQLGGVAIPTNLADKDAVLGLPEAAEQANGPVDVLVNNAAASIVGAFPDRTASEIRTLLETNLLAPVELSRALLPGMIDRGRGAVVNISSVGGELALRNFSTYGAAKAALNSMTHSLRRELRGTGVDSMLVVLGSIDTDMTKESVEDPTGHAIARRFAKLRFLDPAEVAERIAQVIEKPRSITVMPASAAPMVAWRMLPTRIVDLLLTGLPPSITPRAGAR